MLLKVALVLGSPRQDSNLYYEIRNLASCPLNDEGVVLRSGIGWSYEMAGFTLGCCALRSFSEGVDLGRIELPSAQCECAVLPLNHRPLQPAIPNKDCQQYYHYQPGPPCNPKGNFRRTGSRQHYVHTIKACNYHRDGQNNGQGGEQTNYPI